MALPRIEQENVTGKQNLQQMESWARLRAHAEQQTGMSISGEFESDPQRLQRFTVDAAGLRLDLSRTAMSAQTLELLLALAAECKLYAAIASLLAGEPLNNTEGRAALHSALRGTEARAGAQAPFADEVATTRRRVREFVAAVRSGSWRGYSDQRISDVVNIGIGGSHLGPAMVVDALAPFVDHQPHCHFVSNVDPADIDTVLGRLDPASTLFIVASKTFTTMETLENAKSARRWLLAAGCPETALARHFVAVSSRPDRAEAFGIGAEQIYPMWDWVGGRYSLWSAIGLAIELAVDTQRFDALLAGAAAMDRHFRDTPLQANMPVLAALSGVWHRNFLNYQSLAVIPYDQSLARLPEYLQQLVMESNGKSVSRDGLPLEHVTSGVLWGAAGTNGQHSFHQLLHQGTGGVNVDFILPLTTYSSNVEQHAQLVSNCLSQSRALMLGRSAAEAADILRARGCDEEETARLVPHMCIPGNRPSSTISMSALDPATLGALIALYEHRTFCEGWIWGINSFDQFGVELGKELSQAIYPMLSGSADATALDPSSRALIAAYIDHRKQPRT